MDRHKKKEVLAIPLNQHLPVDPLLKGQNQPLQEVKGILHKLKADPDSVAGNIDKVLTDDDFIAAAEKMGVIIDEVICDGEIHRVPTEDHLDKLNGWYICRGKVGWYGNWETQKKQKYPNGEVTLTEAEREDLEEARKIAEEEKARRYADAAVKADGMWNSALPCPADFPYLVGKDVKPHGARIKEDALLINLIDASGKIHSLQRIFPDGTKRMLPGGRVKGCFHLIKGTEKPWIICEGFATGATIAEATGCSVIVAIDAGNIAPVIKEIRDNVDVPLPIVICADNDKIGVEKASRAAAAFGLSVIMPSGIEGSDFNDMAAEKGLQAVKDYILEKLATHTNRISTRIAKVEDLNDPGEFDLKIPKHLYENIGLIGEGTSALVAAGAPDTIQHNLAMTLAYIGNAAAGKIRFEDSNPNIGFLKIGPSQGGKSLSDKLLANQRDNLGHDRRWYGPDKIASGPAMYRILEKQPQCFIMLDEVTDIFRRTGRNDSPTADMKQTVIELLTTDRRVLRKEYSDKRKSFEIKDPVLAFGGNATQEIFEGIEPRDFISGMIPRMDFFACSSRFTHINTSNPAKLNDFLNAINAINELTVVGIKDIGATSAARRLIKDFSVENIKHTHAADAEWKASILTRRFEFMRKYALIHHTAIYGKGLRADMTPASIEWGIEMAALLAAWKINVLFDRTSEGDFHRDCKIFKEAIIDCTNKRYLPTLKNLSGRRRVIKNWTQKRVDAVAETLESRGEIITAVKDNRGGTQYRLITTTK